MPSDLLPTIDFKKGAIEIIDQTLLPAEYRILRLTRVEDLREAMRALRIRGAPALGVAGAYGMLLAVEEEWPVPGNHYFDEDRADLSRFPPLPGVEVLRRHLDGAGRSIAETRPTAVNLAWAVERMKSAYGAPHASPADLLRALHAEARSIHREDIEMCRAIGRHGAAILCDGDSVLTHCNTGGLATGGFGTALGVVFTAASSGCKVQVYADETRPLLQGARLTAWECEQRGVPVSVLCDGAAASLMSRGRVSCVIVGADRVAANGDTANKIGTLGLALAARRFGIPFYVAAPSSSIDPSIPDGGAIPIEERSEEEVKRFGGVEVTPRGARAVNPAFDVTPADLITGFITEKGILKPPFRAGPR